MDGVGRLSPDGSGVSWGTAFKLRIVAETQEPGFQVGAVAAWHGVSESLVFTWRRQGVLVAAEAPVFLPVQAFEASPMSVAGSQPRPELAGLPAPAPAVSLPSRPQASIIEMEFGGSRQVRGLGSDMNLAALRRVLGALRG